MYVYKNIGLHWEEPAKEGWWFEPSLMMIGPGPFKGSPGQRRFDIGGVNIVWINHLCRAGWKLSIYAREWDLEEWFGLRIKWGWKCIGVMFHPFPPPPADFAANLGRTFPPFDKYSLL